MNDEPIVQTHELTKRYGDFLALDKLTLQLHRGQILGFIGPNGAGKTTTIKILVGLNRPTAGWARICGVDCTHDARRIKHLVGYMPDVFGAYDGMRVEEYLDFFGAAFKIARGERRKRIDAVLEATGAAYMRDYYLESLSHGMKQRVAIARTLMHDPQVLILDEPANGLDPIARIEMRELILKLSAAGKTIIVTSHILPELARICTVVAMMTGGVLRAFGTVEQIMQSFRQQRIMEVHTLRPEDLPAIAAIVREQFSVRDSLTISEAERIVRFRTTRDDADLSALLRALHSAGLAITQFREEPQDLEDAFITVAQQPAPTGGST